MKEIWKDIKGYEGLYQVSNKGNVKSLNYRHSGKEGILRPMFNSNKYLIVNLYKNGNHKNLFVHRLVLMTFAPINNMDKLEVNHKDENKQNNNLNNLEWCSRSYNNNYGSRTQRSAQSQSIPVVQLDPTTNKVVNVYCSAREADRQTEFNQGNITQCCKNKLNRPGNNIYKGYKWQYMSDYIKSIDSRIKKVELFDREYNYQ